MKKYLFAILLAGFTHAAFAQASAGADSPRIGFAMQPFMLLGGGLQLDIQPYLKVHPQKHQLVIAPQLYYSNNPLFGELLYQKELTKLRGGGLDLSYRVFPKDGRAFYAGGGVGYTHFQPSYKGDLIDGPDKDANDNFIKISKLVTEKINRFSVNFMLGWQVDKPELYGAFADFYVGAGFRYGASDLGNDAEGNPKTDFSKGMYNMAYQSIYLVLGLKIGFEL